MRQIFNIINWLVGVVLIAVYGIIANNIIILLTGYIVYGTLFWLIVLLTDED